jgi:hypothetical protein
LPDGAELAQPPPVEKNKKIKKNKKKSKGPTNGVVAAVCRGRDRRG